MLSRLREHLGAAGLIVAIVALVAALSGAAIAANGGAGDGNATASAKAKKGPRGPKGPKGDPGPAGPQGPAGPAGSKGDTGSAGSNGTNGATGATGATGSAGSAGDDGKSVEVTQFDFETEPIGEPCNEFGGVEVEVEGSGETSIVCNGETGFTDTLPPGKTETGAWGGGITAAEFTPVPVSFAIPLAEEVEGEVRELNATPNTNCPGSAVAPKAAPGWLCVYTGNESGGTIELSVSPAGGGFGSMSTSGAVVNLEGTPGQFASGTFAVTAPFPGP